MNRNKKRTSLHDQVRHKSITQVVVEQEYKRGRSVGDIAKTYKLTEEEVSQWLNKSSVN